jgi:His/Glu/Gln/Arg/opine family amino acid ABC transporter permease subunit
MIEIKVVPRNHVLLLGRFFHVIQGDSMNIDFTSTIPYIPYLLAGIWITIQIAAIGAFFGTILGFILSFITSKDNLVSKFFGIIIDFFRGTPLLFQIYFLHYGVTQLIPGFVPSAITSASIVFSLNSAAYLSEILRAGINSIDKGQIEAAVSLGVSKRDVAFFIIIPIALKNVLPAIINEFITLTKETSVASYIGVSELLRRFQIVQGTTFRPFEPLIIVGIIYFSMNKILSFFGRRLERKLSYDNR